MRQLISIAIGFFLLSLPHEAKAAWLEGKSSNFVVYSDGDSNNLRASIIALEAHDRLLRQELLAGPPMPGALLPIYLVATREKLREAANVSPNSYGEYRTAVSGTALIAVRTGPSGVGGEVIVKHEYTHHFTMRHRPAYYPFWYAEGLAEYFMTATTARETAEVGRPLAARLKTLASGEWLSAESLLFKPEVTERFYAQSWLLVHYLYADKERRLALESYLKELERGTLGRAAFRRAFGYEVEKLDSELRSYLETGPTAHSVTLMAAPTPEVAIRDLPVLADQLLLPHLAMVLGASATEGKLLLERVRLEAMRAPNDPYSQRIHARAEITFGDSSEGARMINQLLQSEPDDAELLFLRGMVDYRLGREDAPNRRGHFAAARPWFEKALQRDAYYYAAAYKLAECELVSGQAKQAVEHLILAQSEAPMVGVIGLNAAEVLLRFGRVDEARRMLIPLAANPQWEDGRRARAILETLPGGAPD